MFFTVDGLKGWLNGFMFGGVNRGRKAFGFSCWLEVGFVLEGLG